ncbi:MAG TPA: PilZ domain-containing protein, partial [Humisphaera sp.]
MNLSADTFVQIVQSLRSDGGGKNGREQRKNPRVGIRGRVMISIGATQGSRPIQVNVRDLSAAGIGLLHNEPIPKGIEIVLLLPEANDVSRRAIVCQIRRVQQLSASLYSIGASFVRELPTVEAQPGTASRQAVVPPEPSRFVLAPHPPTVPPSPPPA